MQHRLIDQNLISAGAPLVGGGLLGFATGFAIRKNFEQGGDIRTVQSVGKLLRKSDGPQDADRIIQTLTKYSVREKEGRG